MTDDFSAAQRAYLANRRARGEEPSNVPSLTEDERRDLIAMFEAETVIVDRDGREVARAYAENDGTWTATSLAPGPPVGGYKTQRGAIDQMFAQRLALPR
jgi:hypothetical protein